MIAEQRGELIHDPAAHAYVVVFGHLADFGQLFARKPEVVDRVEREAHCAFERGRRRKSRAERDVPAESHVERTDQRPAFLHLLHYAVDVAGPLLCRFFAVQIHFDRLVVIDRMDPALLSVVGFDANVDCLVDSTGQHESQVVVGMFADQVDASGRSEERRSVAVHFFE